MICLAQKGEGAGGYIQRFMPFWFIDFYAKLCKLVMYMDQFQVGIGIGRTQCPSLFAEYHLYKNEDGKHAKDDEISVP